MFPLYKYHLDSFSRNTFVSSVQYVFDLLYVGLFSMQQHAATISSGFTRVSWFSCGGVWPAAAEATFLTLIHKLRPRLFYVLEQPSGSWGFKQPYMVSLIRQLQLWLGIRLCNASKYLVVSVSSTIYQYLFADSFGMCWYFLGKILGSYGTALVYYEMLWMCDPVSVSSSEDTGGDVDGILLPRFTKMHPPAIKL